MSWMHTPQLVLLERFLDVNTARQALVSTNLANVDTPGYHTRDIDFLGELQRAMDGFTLVASNPVVRQVRGLLARPDGNNVSVDRESLLLAQVQLQFKAATAIIKAEFARLHNAIKEGQA
jgi:flagellar basal-body rod protein FlgB